MNGFIGCSSNRPFWAWPVAILIGMMVLGTLVGTSRDFGMVWDEGHTVRRVQLLDGWFSRLADPPAGRHWRDAFSENVLRRSWPFSREEPDGHPPFYAELSLAGHRLTRGWLDPLTTYRFGTMLLCGVTASALWLHLTRQLGPIAGLIGSLCPFIMPRSFAHSHYAHYDMIVSCLWLLAQLAFVNSLRVRGWAMVLGVVLGLAAATKFTGWFAVAPIVLWVAGLEVPGWVAGKSRRSIPPGMRSLLISLPVALVTLYVLQPPWWLHPIDGPLRFFLSNLTRSKTQPIPTLYMGRVYPFSLPWHNTIILTAICVPVAMIFASAFGMGAIVRAWRVAKHAMIWPLSWVVLMVVRALPNAPGHDGIRLFLPSVMSLGVLAGFGVWWAIIHCRSRLQKWILLGGAGLLAIEPCIGIYTTYPYTDSYYNVAIGRLPGAERAGFEITYYWETLGREFEDWVLRESLHDKLGLRLPIGLVNIRYLREWGDLPSSRRVPIVPFEVSDRPSYVLQRRRGVYYPYDWWLERHGRPQFVIRREGVDLLRIYPFDESFRAYQGTRSIPTPAYLRH